MRTPYSTVDGVLLLDKPAGPSSNQVLQHVKRLFRARKAGHAGTLDPMATGMLPILLGEATKFASHIADASKEYEATVLLGVRTTTGDLEGDVIERRPTQGARAAIATVLNQFRGAILQTPPMYSALKVGGQPLYRAARLGQTVHREPRRVSIERLELCEARADEIDLVIECSKGTYIRALAEDLGTALGGVATLKRLRRTRVGPFHIRKAVELPELEVAGEDQRSVYLQPVDAGLEHLSQVQLRVEEAVRIANGQAVERTQASAADGLIRLYAAASGRFLGLGEASGDRILPIRLIAQATADAAARLSEK